MTSRCCRCAFGITPISMVRGIGEEGRKNGWSRISLGQRWRTLISNGKNSTDNGLAISALLVTVFNFESQYFRAIAAVRPRQIRCHNRHRFGPEFLHHGSNFTRICVRSEITSYSSPSARVSHLTQDAFSPAPILLDRMLNDCPPLQFSITKTWACSRHHCRAS